MLYVLKRRSSEKELHFQHVVYFALLYIAFLSRRETGSEAVVQRAFYFTKLFFANFSASTSYYYSLINS